MDSPCAELVAVEVYANGARWTLLVGLDAGSPRVGVVRTRPRGAPAGVLAQRLRRDLVGARLEGVRASADAVCLEIARDDERLTLLVDGRLRTPLLAVLGAGDRVEWCAHPRALAHAGGAVGAPYRHVRRA